jgi:hypothetical protein
MRPTFRNQMGCHLGDMIIFVSAGLRYSAHIGEPVHLEAPRRDRGATSETMIADIAALLESSGSVVASQEDPTVSFGNLWKRLRLCPARQRWAPQRAQWGRIAYQFDGRCMPEKNPPPGDIPRIVSAIGRHGTPERLGLPRTLAESAALLAQSDAFVGCASGLAILAWCVGTPVWYLEYGMPVDRFVRGMPYVKCCGTDDFMNRFSLENQDVHASSR